MRTLMFSDMSTNVNERTLGELRNDSDVLNRLVIAGLLNVLNNSLTYTQVWEDSSLGIQKVTVPFFYELGTDNTEKFIQDNYFLFGDSCNFPKIIGNFDMFPRGTIRYTGANIDNTAITNRFVLGNYTRREKTGNLESYISFLYSIPLSMNFEVTLKIDTLITSFKIEEAIREFFYKNKTFYVMYRGMKLGCRAGFPEAIQSDKLINYKFGVSDQDRNITMTFPIVVETYQPVFDPTTEMKASNNIKGIAYDAHISDKEAIGWIQPTEDYSNSTIPSGIKLLFQWNYIKDSGDMRTVNIDAYKEDGTVEHLATVYNSLSYIWEIPEGYGGMEPINVTIINSDKCQVHKIPSIKIVPDIETKKVSPSNVFIENGGFFLTESDAVQADVIISFKASNGKIVEKNAKLNVFNNQIDSRNPLEFEPFKYTGKINGVKMNIKLSDAIDSNLEYVMESVTIL